MTGQGGSEHGGVRPVRRSAFGAGGRFRGLFGDHGLYGRSVARAVRPGRRRWALAAGGAIAAVTATLAMRPQLLLVWNISPSAPVGLYGVGGVRDLARGDMVIARVPAGLRLFAARRGYLPLNVPLVKRVAAVPGDRVCAIGFDVAVNGRRVSTRRAIDAGEREMPWWSGCVQLAKGHYFLLMSENPDSFDGRYFGISEAGDIVGRASLLWRA